MARSRLILIAALAGLVLCTSAAAGASEAGAAESAPGYITALEDVHLNGEIDGDVLVVDGDVFLGSQAHVKGHVIVLMGKIEAEPGARVDGRAIAMSSLAALTLQPDSSTENGGLRLAVSLLFAGAWLLATSLLAFFYPVRMRRAVWLLPRLGWRVLLIGVVANVTVIAAMVAVLGLGPTLGVPLVAALSLAYMIGKAIGLTILGGHLGSWVLERWVHRPLPLSVSVFIGVAGLLAMRFVPLAGSITWAVISIAALGTGVLSVGMATNSGLVELPEPSSRNA